MRPARRRSPIRSRPSSSLAAPRTTRSEGRRQARATSCPATARRESYSRCRNGRQHRARKLHRHQRHGHGSHPEREQRRDRVERRDEQHYRRHNRRGAQHHLWQHHVRSVRHSPPARPATRSPGTTSARTPRVQRPFRTANDGVRIQSPGNTIGGTAAGAGNLISGNLQRRRRVNGAGANNNIVQGNRIGTNADVTAAIPNTFRGVAMFARRLEQHRRRRRRRSTQHPVRQQHLGNRVQRSGNERERRVGQLHRDERHRDGRDSQRSRRGRSTASGEQHDWRTAGCGTQRHLRQQPDGRSIRKRRNDREPGARQLHRYERHWNWRRSQWRLRRRCEQYREREHDWRRADRRGQRHLRERDLWRCLPWRVDRRRRQHARRQPHRNGRERHRGHRQRPPGRFRHDEQQPDR